MTDSWVLGGKKEGQKAAERRVEQDMEIAERLRRHGLMKRRDILAERNRRISVNSPGSKSWTPTVEAMADGSRGVVCHTMGSVKCLAQVSADELSLHICHNCNLAMPGIAAREAFYIEERQRLAFQKKWAALKNGTPATAPFMR